MLGLAFLDFNKPLAAQDSSNRNLAISVVRVGNHMVLAGYDFAINRLVSQAQQSVWLSQRISNLSEEKDGF